MSDLNLWPMRFPGLPRQHHNLIQAADMLADAVLTPEQRADCEKTVANWTRLLTRIDRLIVAAFQHPEQHDFRPLLRDLIDAHAHALGMSKAQAFWYLAQSEDHRAQLEDLVLAAMGFRIRDDEE